MKRSRKWLLNTALVTVAASIAFTVESQQVASNDTIEEVVTIGSRSQKPRTATDSTVPVDVFSETELSSFGNQADLTDTLKSLVPSYTATPATGDGSAFIRPTSLRGMAPDQSLILVNGKRRHRSALVQFFAPAAGNGAHGVDVGMIPSIAVKNIEVLRDGAAAQYGSDAIAGVLNFQLKDASEGGKVTLQYGEFYDGEESLLFAANGGFALGADGFVNVSFETNDNDALSRGNQRPDAQALIDAGVPGVGADGPFGDAPLAQSWGRPETSGNRFFLNSGLSLGDLGELYLHAGYADTEGRYRFFYRTGYDTAADCTATGTTTAHSTLDTLCDLGFTGLRQGYTPYLDGDQTDITLVTGLKGEFSNDMTYDFSIGYGKNELEYFLNNTINTGLGLTAGLEIPQRDFNMGGYEQEEINLNADFSKALSSTWNLGFGFEWREETFTTVPGEFNAYGVSPGPSGMTSVSPADAGEFDRDNYALYVDLEQDVSDDWLMQYALRYEDFSDFGDTTNGKVATRYRVSDAFTLRGAVSTGFHAPTPGQANVSTIITTFDGSTGAQVEEGLVPPTSAIAIQNGGKELTEETSVNYSVGFTSDLTDTTTLTFDMYLVEVDDRIYRTGDIVTTGGQTISFYTNALDVEHQGFDLVLTSSFDWAPGIDTVASFAFNYNEIDVTGQTAVNGINPVSASLIEDIENNYPEERFVINTLTRFAERWSFMARLNYYGEHYDERGTINDPVAPSAEIDSIIYVDVELGVDITENFNITAGGANIFDEFVDEINAPNSNRNSVGLQYPRRTAANYEGGSWYLRGTYSF